MKQLIVDELKKRLNPNQHQYIPILADILSNAATNGLHTLQIDDHRIQPLINALEGFQISIGGSLFRFGASSHVGNISAQNIAGRDVYITNHHNNSTNTIQYNVTLPQDRPSRYRTSRGRTQNKNRRILTYKTLSIYQRSKQWLVSLFFGVFGLFIGWHVGGLFAETQYLTVIEAQYLIYQIAGSIIGCIIMLTAGLITTKGVIRTPIRNRRRRRGT